MLQSGHAYLLFTGFRINQWSFEDLQAQDQRVAVLAKLQLPRGIKPGYMGSSRQPRAIVRPSISPV